MAEGVYGDMLAFFPELFQNVPYYEREPKVGAGYEEKASGYEDVIIMPEKTLTQKDCEKFWKFFREAQKDAFEAGKVF